MFKPAIAMTVNMLSAATKSATVKRVVITSSITPFIPIFEFAAGKLANDLYRRMCKPFKIQRLLTVSADEETCHYDMKAQYPHELLAYGASKSMSLDAAEDFIKTHKPKYDVVFLMPSLVIGPNPLSKTAEDYISGTNAPLLRMLLGRPGRPMLGSSISVQDVAKLHVKALDASIPAGRYLAASGGSRGTQWADAFGIIKEHFPDASGNIFKTEGKPVVVPINVDASKTEKAFGIAFKSFEEQVKSVAENYLALL
jgi:nucleoside-diphosphate-sugar epimerase